MFSVLIPLYNCDAFPLVEEISKQAMSLQTSYEIIVFDDKSTIQFPRNERIEEFPYTQLIRAKENGGRTFTRQQLAHIAQFEHLLFLDADVIPVSDRFLSTYINLKDEQNEVIIGGIAYSAVPPKDNSYLRWYYGKEREEKPAIVRAQNPYIVVSANMWIKKVVFLSINLQLDNLYGMDNLFSYSLKEKNILVKHIDNPVYHLGLEENSIFLSKSIKAIETLVKLESKVKVSQNITSLQKAYLKLKRFHLNKIFLVLLIPFIGLFRKNLLSKRPKLVLLDLYKLYHYTRLKL